MTTDNQDDGTIKVRIPATLTLRDIITFVALAVSITMAWGVFGTRLTVVENQLVAMSKVDADFKLELKEMTQRVNQLENRLRENENLSEELWKRMREKNK
jgi:sensor histidine kinase YesM